MKPLLLLVGASLLGLVSVACGGKSTSVDPLSSSQSSSTAGKGDKPASGNDESSANAAAGSAPAAPPPNCVYTGGGGSSGGGNGTSTCASIDSYECKVGNKEQEIQCTCTAQNGGPWGQGSCSCNGLTFPFDCTNACTIGAAEYAKCNLPPPPPDPPSNGGVSSGSTSSSSSGGSSSSSSSGSSGS